MEDTTKTVTGARPRTTDKGMSVQQAMNCLEVAMKWSSGFKKVILSNETPDNIIIRIFRT